MQGEMREEGDGRGRNNGDIEMKDEETVVSDLG